MNGLVVGKFCPLHLGHELLISTALANVEKLLIISYTSQDLGFTPVLRKRYLSERFPSATVFVPVSGFPVDSAPDGLQREYCGIVAEELDIIPDVVFTSEAYGDGFADHLSKMFGKTVKHYEVDRARALVPISGTELRANKDKWDKFVHSDVRRIIDAHR